MSIADLDLRHSRILLLRQGGLGDALVCVPVVRALRQALPDATIDLLLSRRNFVVAPAYRPYVNRIWNYTKRPLQTAALFLQLHRQRYDLAIDLIDAPSTTSRLLLGVSGARARLGIGRRQSKAYTDAAPSLVRPDMHIVERLSQILVPLGINPSTVPLDLEFPLTDAERETAEVLLGPKRDHCRIGINLSGGFAAKYWGRDNFVALIGHLRQRYPEAEVLVLASPEYEAEVSAIAAAAGARAVPPVPSFTLFAALLHSCDFLVTPDTSVSHLAAAWKIPAVVLFIQRESPASILWAPYHSPHKALFDAERVSAIPRGAVIEAADQLLLEHSTLCH